MTDYDDYLKNRIERYKSRLNIISDIITNKDHFENSNIIKNIDDLSMIFKMFGDENLIKYIGPVNLLDVLSIANDAIEQLKPYYLLYTSNKYKTDKKE